MQKKEAPKDDILEKKRIRDEAKAFIKAKKEKIAQGKLDAVGTKVSSRLQPELDAMQKRKTFFMMLSTLCFAVFLFIKVEANEKLWTMPTAVGIYFALILFGVVLSVYVSYNNFKKHRLRICVSDLDAPRDGFDKHTYSSYELFTLYHIAIAILQLGIVVWSVGIWGLVSVALLIASAVFAVLSRQILFKANAHVMTSLPPKNPLRNLEPKDSAENKTEQNNGENVTENDSQQNNGETTTENEAQQNGGEKTTENKTEQNNGEKTTEKIEKEDNNTIVIPDEIEDFYSLNADENDMENNNNNIENKAKNNNNNIENDVKNDENNNNDINNNVENNKK